MVADGKTDTVPVVPTYPTLLRYTQESAFDVDHESVEPEPWFIGFGERETEQEAGGGSVQVMYTAPEEPLPAGRSPPYAYGAAAPPGPTLIPRDSPGAGAPDAPYE